MARDPDYLLNEIERIREWRHSVVTPQLAALSMRAEAFGSLLDGLTASVNEYHRRFDELAKRDEIEEAVSKATKEAVAEERSSWMARIKLPWRIVLGVLGALVAVSAIGNFVLRLIGLS